MGLLGSLARRTGAAALYGSGRLVSVVVPDSVTPWNLRRTAAKTSGSLIGLGVSAYRKTNKKKKPTKKRSIAYGPKPTPSPKQSGNLGFGGLLPFLARLKPKKGTALLVVTSAPSSTPSAGRGVRQSTTKGKTNLSRRKVWATPPEKPSGFSGVSWGRGAAMSTASDWDAPDPAAIAAAKRRRSRVARAAGKYSTRKSSR
jgi:hypothetical protein